MRTLVVSLLVLAISAVAQDDAAAQKARVRGVRNFAKQGAGGIPLIAPYLDDTDAEVRWEAAKAIADIGGPTSIEPLVKATADNEGQIQMRAVEGLVNFYHPGYLKTGITAPLRKAGGTLKGKFTDTNTDIIDPAVSVKPEVIAALGKVARGGVSIEARAAAARGLGILRGKAALPDLHEALRSKENTVLFETVIAIQKIRDPESGPRIQFLLRDLQERLQVAVIETTGVLRNHAALSTLRELASDGNSARVRRAALGAVAMMPEEASRSLYTKFFEDRDDGMRGAAAEGLGRLKNSADIPTAGKAFNEEKKMGPRLSMAFALVMLGKLELTEFSPLQYLVNTLNSRSYRDAAAPLLIELARDEAIRKAIYPALDRSTATKDEKIRLAAVLSASGGRDTIPVLEKLGKDPDVEIAQEGIRAVRNLQARLP